MWAVRCCGLSDVPSARSHAREQPLHALTSTAVDAGQKRLIRHQCGHKCVLRSVFTAYTRVYRHRRSGVESWLNVLPTNNTRTPIQEVNPGFERHIALGTSDMATFANMAVQRRGACHGVGVGLIIVVIGALAHSAVALSAPTRMLTGSRRILKPGAGITPAEGVSELQVPHATSESVAPHNITIRLDIGPLRQYW